jgi:uncharacterized membrane protein YhaH (DUF805 family)
MTSRRSRAAASTKGADVTMSDAVRSCLSKYATFSGRARRAEYWWFTLAVIIVEIVTSLIDRALGTSLVTLLVALALFLPGLAVGVRRLHDTDRSGWWLLIALVPFVGAIVLLVFEVLDGTPGPNRFGPSPKQVTTDSGYGTDYGRGYGVS